MIYKDYFTPSPMVEEDYLEHHGVLGMKWGVRRFQNADGTLTAKGKARQEKDLVKADKDFAKPKNVKVVVSKANQDLQNNKAYQNEAVKVAQKLVDAGLQGSALENAYQQQMLDVIDKYLAKDSSTYNPSGTARVTMGGVEINGNYFMTPIMVDSTKIKHAEDEYVYGLYLVDKKGVIRLYDDETFEHYDKDEFLMHFGVLGMKWGVRKDRPSGADRKIMRDAKKDAQKYVEAKVSRGEGAGNKRKQINAIVNQRRKQSDLYNKTFDEILDTIDRSKAVNKAERWRRREDTKSQTKRSTKAMTRALTGTSSLAAAGILYMQHKPAVDAFVRNAMSEIKRRF